MTPDSVANAMLDCVRAATASSGRSAQTWPGFLLHDQAIILVNEESGPVVLVANGPPPPEYRAIAAASLIYERGGMPPDSLRGLQVGTTWNLRKGVATVVPFPKHACPEMVVHESFHTYQRRRMTERAAGFVGGGTLRFPAPREELSAVQLLEGHFLAQALASPDAARERRSVELAAASHTRLCEMLGERACRDVANVEDIEGSADYVAMSLLLGTTPAATQQHVRDSLRVRLERVTDARQLGRNYAFLIGAAWMFLASKDHIAGWQQVIEREGFQELTRRVVHSARVTRAVDERSAVFLGPLDSLRRVSARLLHRAIVRSDSAERTFAAVQGTIIRVEWTARGRISSHIRTGPAGIETDYTVRFGDGADVLTVDSLFQRSCCPPSVRAKARTSDVQLRVSGRAVATENNVHRILGPVELRTPHFNLAYHSAVVRLEGDSILVQLTPGVARHE
jgi:hypothetical protein